MDDESKTLLALIRDRYISSGDFNGYFLSATKSGALVSAAKQLVGDGLVQVITQQDFMNVHIRPFSAARSLEAQLKDLDDLAQDNYGLCLYPTNKGMKGYRLPASFHGKPLSRELARGAGTMDLIFFRFEVLEQYRNDPRYQFDFGDVGAHMGISDPAFFDPLEPDADKVSMRDIGFAYNLAEFDPTDSTTPIERGVTALLGDLAKLSPEHQQRWATYRITGTSYVPHPLWWDSIRGHWPEKVGPFERLFSEIEAINELTKKAFGRGLFRTSVRPSSFGWLLRPTVREWDEFNGQLDKLLSENLDAAFFKTNGIASVDEHGDNIGTLRRLELFMLQNGVQEVAAREVLGPLRAVRKARQGPAHAIRQNAIDKSYIRRQIQLLRDVNQSLISLRDWFASHPSNIGWTHPFEDLGDVLF